MLFKRFTSLLCVGALVTSLCPDTVTAAAYTSNQNNTLDSIEAYSDITDEVSGYSSEPTPITLGTNTVSVTEGENYFAFTSDADGLISYENYAVDDSYHNYSMSWDNVTVYSGKIFAKEGETYYLCIDSYESEPYAVQLVLNEIETQTLNEDINNVSFKNGDNYFSFKPLKTGMYTSSALCGDYLCNTNLLGETYGNDNQYLLIAGNTYYYEVYADLWDCENADGTFSLGFEDVPAMTLGENELTLTSGESYYVYTPAEDEIVNISHSYDYDVHPIILNATEDIKGYILKEETTYIIRMYSYESETININISLDKVLITDVNIGENNVSLNNGVNYFSYTPTEDVVIKVSYSYNYNINTQIENVTNEGIGFALKAGTTYFIRVYSYEGETINTNMSLNKVLVTDISVGENNISLNNGFNYFAYTPDTEIIVSVDVSYGSSGNYDCYWENAYDSGVVCKMIAGKTYYYTIYTDEPGNTTLTLNSVTLTDINNGDNLITLKPGKNYFAYTPDADEKMNYNLSCDSSANISFSGDSNYGMFYKLYGYSTYYFTVELDGEEETTATLSIDTIDERDISKGDNSITLKPGKNYFAYTPDADERICYNLLCDSSVNTLFSEELSYGLFYDLYEGCTYYFMVKLDGEEETTATLSITDYVPSGGISLVEGGNTLNSTNGNKLYSYTPTEDMGVLFSAVGNIDYNGPYDSEFNRIYRDEDEGVYKLSGGKTYYFIIDVYEDEDVSPVFKISKVINNKGDNTITLKPGKNYFAYIPKVNEKINYSLSCDSSVDISFSTSSTYGLFYELYGYYTYYFTIELDDEEETTATLSITDYVLTDGIQLVEGVNTINQTNGYKIFSYTPSEDIEAAFLSAGGVEYDGPYDLDFNRIYKDDDEGVYKLKSGNTYYFVINTYEEESESCAFIICKKMINKGNNTITLKPGKNYFAYIPKADEKVTYNLSCDSSANISFNRNLNYGMFYELYGYSTYYFTVELDGVEETTATLSITDYVPSGAVPLVEGENAINETNGYKLFSYTPSEDIEAEFSYSGDMEYNGPYDSEFNGINQEDGMYMLKSGNTYYFTINAYDEEGASSVFKISKAFYEHSDYMWYRLKNGNLDIRGYNKEEGTKIQTTFANGGYSTVLKTIKDNLEDNGDEETLRFYEKNKPVEHTSGLIVTPEMSFSEDGTYTTVTYKVENPTENPITFSLNVNSDIDIDGDDHADVYLTNTGLSLISESGAAYYFICNNVPGITDADTMWFGYYYDRLNNLWNDYYTNTLTDTDSGLSVAWQNRTVAPGTSTYITYQLGIGENGSIIEPEDTIVAYGDISESLRWTINNSGVLSIRGTGAIPDYEPGTAPWNEYSTTVKKIIVGYGVTRIGDYVFYGLSNCEGVRVSPTVESVGNQAIGFTDDGKIGVVIEAYTGSAAAQYANDNGFSIGELGDENGENHTHEYYEDENVAASCTEEGHIKYVCIGCGDTYTDTIQARGHSYSQPVVVAATCTTEGTSTSHCLYCRDEKIEKTPALGHTEVVITAVAATCTSSGSTEGTRCSICNEIIKKPETIEAKGHSFLQPVIKAATCTTAGTKTSQCKNCTYKAVVTIAAKGHSYDSGKITKNPSYSSMGEKTYSCKCGSTKKETLGYKELKKPSIVSASVSSGGISIKWKKVTGATGYEVYRNGKKIKSTSGNGSVSFTDKSPENGKENSYTVIAKAGNNRSKASAVKKCGFLKKPSLKPLSSKGSGKVTVKWSKNDKADGYQIKLTLKGKTNNYKVKGAKTVKKVIGSLKKKQTYSVSVRAYKTISGKKCYSAWSATKKIKIK